MDNEYDLLTENNEKYSIKINDYKARLRAIEKELRNESINVKICSFKSNLKLVLF
jgi:hypothetical protein